MPKRLQFLVLSDIHYAGRAEKERGCLDHEVIEQPLLRLAVKMFRFYVWRRDPFGHNGLLDRVLSEAGSPDYVFANGDFSCDTAFIGVSDPAAYESAEECLGRLRQQYGGRLHNSIGDHELGKMSLFGGRGGLRLASWERTIHGLGIPPFWELEIGRYKVIGVTSSLIALPVYDPEVLDEERVEWQDLRAEQMGRIRACFSALRPEQRLIIFCHDPTALPFLWHDPAIRSKLDQVALTFIGHLHSELFLWKSRLLSGMPAIHFLGNSIRRMSQALNEARLWKPFKAKLCPSLAGIQLLKDGGYYRIQLDEDAKKPLEFERHRLPWN